MERVFELFPRLKERRAQSARTLSGGEQQMLAVGRALLINPRLLVLDEATEGLAPLIRQEIWNCLRRLKEEGQTILVIDKNLKEMATLVDRHHVLEKAAWSGRAAPRNSPRSRSWRSGIWGCSRGGVRWVSRALHSGSCPRDLALHPSYVRGAEGVGWV